MNTGFEKQAAALLLFFVRQCSWIPGSSLREAPE